MSATFGKSISYAGAALTGPAHGWRWMVVIGAVPPIVLFFILPLCPESLRSLIAHGKRDEAPRVIVRVFPHATEAQVIAKVDHIEHEIRVETALRSLKHPGADLDLRYHYHFSAWWFQYSHILLSNTLRAYWFENATAVSIVVGATNFIFTIVNLVIVDRVGRGRIPLDHSTWNVPNSCALRHCFLLRPGLERFSPRGNFVLVAIILEIAFFSGGIATIAWIGTELLPLEVRALGSMMNNVTFWGCNIIIASTFLSIMKGITPSGASSFYSGICFLSWIFLIFCYAEITRLALEHVRQVFEHRFGVKVARQMKNERKHNEEAINA
ncbi:putative Major facilitator superfamily (MFS) profile domain-containing protein [Seiridium cardinale]